MDCQEVARDKKKAQKARAWIVFQDESGVSQKPPLRRTWAPKGQTPVILHPFNWKKLSISGALAYRWDGKLSRIYFQMIEGSYDTPQLICFLKELKRHFKAKPVILIWDGLPSHRGTEMRGYIESQADWLLVEQLPGYAPDLNPVEGLWNNIKSQELANQSPDDLGDVAVAVNAGFERVKTYKQLTFSFLAETGLSFD